MKLRLLTFAATVGMASALHGQRGGLQTQFIRKGDTTIARVTGAVPANALKRLAEVVRIEPTVDDTSMYTFVSDVVVDRQNRSWVFDDDLKTIFLFDARGTLVRRVGRKGGGPGEFQYNGGMTFLGDGRLAVLDQSNGRLSFFSPSGDFLTSWPVPATSFMSKGALVTDSTDALVIERDVRFENGQSQQLMLKLRPGGGGFTADTVLVPSSDAGAQTLTVGVGPRRTGLGLPFQPYVHRGWQRNGTFATVHGATGVLTIPQTGGGIVRVERNAPRVPVTAKERSEAEAMVTYRAKAFDPNWTWSIGALPATKPPANGLFVARDGRIWVQAAGEAVPVPDGHSVVQRPGRPVPPPRTLTSATVWEVYESNGTFLGRIPVAKHGRPVHAFGNDVWVTEQTSDGFTAVVRYRIEPGL